MAVYDLLDKFKAGVSWLDKSTKRLQYTQEL